MGGKRSCQQWFETGVRRGAALDRVEQLWNAMRPADEASKQLKVGHEGPDTQGASHDALTAKPDDRYDAGRNERAVYRRQPRSNADQGQVRIRLTCRQLSQLLDGSRPSTEQTQHAQTAETLLHTPSE